MDNYDEYYDESCECSLRILVEKWIDSLREKTERKILIKLRFLKMRAIRVIRAKWINLFGSVYDKLMFELEEEYNRYSLMIGGCIAYAVFHPSNNLAFTMINELTAGLVDTSTKICVLKHGEDIDGVQRCIAERVKCLTRDVITIVTPALIQKALTTSLSALKQVLEAVEDAGERQ